MSATYSLYVLPSRRCHCRGTGWVIMDDAAVRFPGRGVMGEPCPMCTLGARHSNEVVSGIDLVPSLQTKDPKILSSVKRDQPIPRAGWRNRDGQYINTPDYYHGVHVDQLTWLNGMTVYHRYECATMGCWGFVDAPSTRCDGCDPSPSLIPSTAAIAQATKLKLRGDERSIYDLALACQEQLHERQAAMRRAAEETDAMQSADHTRDAVEADERGDETEDAA